MPSVAFSESSSVAGAPPHATSGILGADAGTNPRAIETGVVSSGLIEETARELMWRAAIAIPEDFRKSVVEMAEHETNPLSKYVLEQIGCNYEAAVEDKRPMCGDTGLPRYFVKMGNDCRLEGGFAALERALRMVVDTHIEIAYAHTGGMPVAIHTFCFASRRATARLTPDGQVRFRSDPQWFTPYYRREGIE